MKIAVIGVGGIGGYFGGRLVQSGEDVVFIARGKTLQILKNKGLRVDSINGNFVLGEVQATDRPEEIGKVDVVLLCVKTWQVKEVLSFVPTLIGPNTFVVSFQNGIEIPEQLVSALGKEYIIPGLAKIISFKMEPGYIRHIGAEPYVAFGELDNHLSKRIEKLLNVFKKAGIKSEIPKDIWVALWSKFLFIASWGGIGALTRVPIGIIRSLPETRKMLRDAMIEISELAKGYEVTLPDNIVDKTLNFIDALLPQSTTSLQRDIASGKPSELSSWNGAVVHLGEKRNIKTPVNTFIYHALLPLELKARGEI